MRKEKLKKDGKDFLKDIIALICIIAVCFGGYKLYANYKTSSAQNDTSYKVKTKRNNKYNGVYSLTKLDENGKNTWDGLMLYVKNDKIVSCARFDYVYMEDVKTKLIEKYGDKYKNMSNKELHDDHLNLEIADTESELLSSGIRGVLDTGFSSCGGIGSFNEKGVFTGLGEFVCPDKVDFEKVTDIKTDYDYMQSCLIVPGYDEDSREVWLSKLLSNEKSEYHDGYKLIKYNGFDDIQKRCRIDNGGCIDKLNKLFNAGL